MENPFENPGDTGDTYRVLVNDEGQHSLWPVSATIPNGWNAIHGPADRQSCLDYVESHWTDMRPKSLVTAMANPERQCS